MAKTDLLQGTLDLLVLKILALGPNHGWGISNRLRQISKDGLTASQGSLYPDAAPARDAGLRHVRDGGVREQPAGARLHVDRRGRRQLASETENFEQFVLSVKRILQRR